MRSQKPKNLPDDGERMTRARHRLEELLRDPGPGITVTPVGRNTDRLRQAISQNAQAQAAAKPDALATQKPETQKTEPRKQPTGSSRRPGSQPRPRQESRVAAQSKTAATSSSAHVGQVPSPVKARTSQKARAPSQDQPSTSAENAKTQSRARITPDAAPSNAARTATKKSPPQQAARPSPVKPGNNSAQIPSAPQPSVTYKHGELANALRMSKRAFMAAGLFSCVINLLMLAGPLFMLQVYDRVITSGSIPTLIALSLMTAGAYLIIGTLEFVRSRLIVRMGLEVDQRISSRIFEASLRHGLAGSGQSNHALRELDQLRQFIASPGPLTFFDAPWTPIYLLVIFLTHWALGVTATIGALVLLSIAWMSENRSRDPQVEAGAASARALELAETGQRNAEALTAMGMVGAYRARWERANADTLSWQLLASDRLGGMSALSKTCKLLFQSLMLAIAALLALNGLISAGAIVAATIIFGRALAPVDQAIGHWRQFLKTRTSYAKLDALLKTQPLVPKKTALPTPQGHLSVSSLRVSAPNSRQIILANISFKIAPGKVLAVIGPSASGKSTLVRTLVGMWKPTTGTITLDGARLDQWDSEALGRHIGYLPQSVELFSGSVKENIARFTENAQDNEVVDAAKQAHAHELILELPDGYDTQVGPYATHLSGGQRQRIALARAMFRHPALVILDEPNANLDRVGDVALTSAIDGCRERGQAVVLVSHRVQAIGTADLLLYLDHGVQRAFGPREQIMKLFQNDTPGGEASAAPRAQEKPSGPVGANGATGSSDGVSP